MTRLVTECGLCGGQNLELVLSLGSSPPTCVMARERGPETHYPLELLRCSDCTLVQLSCVVDPETLFPAADYPYSSGNSRQLHENFEDLARQARNVSNDGVASKDLVVDIGANDGTLLSKFPYGRKVGVEPTRQGEKITGEWYRGFFDWHVAKRIRAKYGPAKVITACNVLAHVEDIDDVMCAVELLLDDDGILVAENHDLASVVDGQWDTVYHEHLRYFDPYTFSALLASHGLISKVCQPVETHGGSFRMIADKAEHSLSPGCYEHQRTYDFASLKHAAQDARRNLRDVLSQGGACGIGATARATTIINYCGLDVEDIEYVCEVSGSDKIGRYVPGTRIPIVDEERLFEDQRPAVLFSWHLADVIIPKLRERGYTGTIIGPLPTPQPV